MKTVYILLLFACFVNAAHSQKKEICVSDEISLERQNEISKCLIENKANSRKNATSDRLLSSKKNVVNRFLVKRNKPSVNSTKKDKLTKIAKLDCNGVAIDKGNPILNTISVKDLASHIANKKEFFEFDEVDQIPLFNGCERGSYDDDLYCFNMNISNYISMNSDDLDEIDSSKDEEVVQVSFIINSKGKIADITTKGLEKEKKLHNQIVDLVQNMADFTPAKNNGKKVSVKYSFEIRLSSM